MKRGLTKEPSIKGMLFTAMSGVTLGLALGCVLLIQEKPMKASSSNSVSHVQGFYRADYSVGSVASEETPTTRSRMSRLNRKTPGPISFTESELNHYLSEFKSSETNEDGSPADISFSAPNVCLEEKAIVLNTKVVVNPKSDRFEVMVQAFCHFEQGADGPEMKLDRLVLNSFVVPEIGSFVGDMFMAKLSAMPWRAEMVDCWKAIREIELLEDTIVLVL